MFFCNIHKDTIYQFVGWIYFVKYHKHYKLDIWKAGMYNIYYYALIRAVHRCLPTNTPFYWPILKENRVIFGQKSYFGHNMAKKPRMSPN